ncbi:o-succinylbenzoate synthase [Capnocytophaga canimorsus]|uniref:L-Ala-D/L-Glu epimerase n=1 Tax=Capnocytophaga canimorsus (strain 5) TaxID=860228 RepID=F9YVB0_CAPCC|nr:o-succinylbenzoate synthase [Capnocytophaga canimorsus]AEK23155.1 L-Ala-D/L-Glu epimerase [Capnocytophaga canimorsus Cc5]WGU67752.1 o-succinylbenzoate synthase [Capnocytophaga canimorsus]
MNAFYEKYILNFKRPSGTSRGILTQKETYFLVITDGEKRGIGECGLLKTLSFDDRPDYEDKLQWVCDNIALGETSLLNELTEFPSIQFGVEQAFRSLKSDNQYILFPSDFTEGKSNIPINGLIWMGTPEFMKSQIRKKLSQGFHCIKMKIGAIAFEQEYEILKNLRKEFSTQDIEIRVDANGAFVPEEALEKLKRLSELELHSIEQPIKVKQIEQMATLCQNTPIPIALDEELIGVIHFSDRKKLLEEIKPQYIIIKPSLLGGYKNSEEWISLAEKQKIGWWITSALESNIGLNAIAQWTFTLNNPMPQGLGTGALYTNNIVSPLLVEKGTLGYKASIPWEAMPLPTNHSQSTTFS